MQKTAWAAVGVAAFLILIKLVAYLLTDSIAMLASLADSALDVFASSINLLAIRHALTPADYEHRFGHGKAEPMAGLMQGAFIAGSVAFLTIESVGRLMAPHPIEHGMVALGVMAVSIAATIALVAVQQITVARTGSIAISADRMHYVGDLADQSRRGAGHGAVDAVRPAGSPIRSSASSSPRSCRGAPGMSSARATTS